MSILKGTTKVDNLVGTDLSEQIFAESGHDAVAAGGGDDVVFGGGGDDRLAGEAGNDTIFGASNSAGVVDLNKFQIAEATTAKITFMGESAGYKNALGVYKIAADGTIYDAQILFANASLKGSGGNLVSGKSTVEVDLAAGDRLGYFVVPNGFAQSGMSKLLSDEKGSFKFVDAKGQPANVNGGVEPKLVHVSASGLETVVKSQYGTSVFHSHGGAEGGLNGDKYAHTTAQVDVASGTVTIGFEDLWKGGDKDFDDSVFKVEIGSTNAALLPRESEGSGKSTDHDAIAGGVGDDKLFGMGGNDTVAGGEGNDQIWGNSGNDALDGGDGNDVVSGGSGDDKLAGGEGDDMLSGNSGDDVIDGGAGGDTIAGDSGNDRIFDGAGNDSVTAGSGDDVMVAGEGDDSYDGESGFDTLDYSGSRSGMSVDLSKHIAVGMGTDKVWSVERVIGSSLDDTLKGDKRDNVFEGGDGNDRFRGLGGADVFTGGAGKDTYQWYAKDVVDEKSGVHLGVDQITDLEVGDVLDLHELVKGQSFKSLDEVVRISDSERGATVAVKIGDAFVDVVTVSGFTADDLLAGGMILA